jgi:dymeclin
MASTQLYIPQGTPTSTSSSQHIFLEALVAQNTLAGPAVQALLLHFISSPIPPSGLSFYTPTTPRGALYFVKAAASSVIWLPYSAYSLIRRSGGGGEGASAQNSPLADAAISLLLALYFYPPSNLQQENPFRRALRNLQDTDDIASTDAAAEAAEGGRGAGGGGGVGGAASAIVPYAALFDSLGRSILHKESSVLLLYALIHGTPHFNNYCMARSDIDTILLPILELLYTARGRSANQLYMLLIILLILSQETAFASNIHRIPLRSVPFYKERPLVDTTLGSLLIVLLLRTAHFNLAALKDVYLHTNCLATMANLAPSMTNLSVHTSQRLVHLLQSLQKRYSKLLAAEKEDHELFSEHGEEAVPASVERERRVLELQLYSDFLRIVLEIINAILINGLPQNPELVYALLHRREVFEMFQNDSSYTDLMENIHLVIDHFGRKIDSVVCNENENVSAEKVLKVIKTASIGWRKEKLRTFPELKFTYEEEASPEDFFVPYIWSLVVSSLSIPWTLSAITAFVPVMPKEEEEKQQSGGGSGRGGAGGGEIEMHSRVGGANVGNSSDVV